ncbi:MAG TPA: GMC family oxidoreductase [Solirubrobacterales bacterium]|nr:GMC family oxidoreductase [Solirubrobacterales bacterium]
MPGAAYDVIIVGGGSAGCVLASRLSKDQDRSVCLVEAGPDYGPFEDGRWPADMLDGRLPPDSHDWSDAEGTLPVARILGGCSAHNMCTLMHGAPADYDAWAELTGKSDLGHDGFQPYLDRAREVMTQRVFSESELDPWFQGLAAASRELGIAVNEDGNDPGATEGIGPLPINLRGTTRWNAAFAYLDPVRKRGNLTILADALVDRVSLDGRRVTGVEVIEEGERRTLGADLVVISAGAYGSPAILKRSGIGPETELAELGIPVREPLPVGDGLRDHFGVPVRFAPSGEMAAEIAEHRRRHDEASIVGVFKARSGSCPDRLWDLHLLAATFPAGDGVVLALSSMLLQAEWTGSVRLRSSDPADLPRVTEIDLETGGDMGAALEGVELARELAKTEALRGRIAEELSPGAVSTPEAIRAGGREALTNYFHPVATCAMGEMTEAAGLVRGFENLHVVDASVIPRPLRASPHLTVLALAERAADLLCAP